PSIELLELIGVVRENGNEQTSIPPVHTPLSYDYVLVAKTVNKQEREISKKQKEYIEELKKKNIKVTKIDDDDLVFYGIQAPKEIFEKYRYLLKVSDACNWSSDQNIVPLSTRIRIVHFILNHTPIHSGENLRDLMKMKVFEARFCLHEKKKQRELKESWARWTACLQGQPINAVRSYFGEKVALYYLWLGWYTFLLIPPALIGVIVFLYGLAFFNSSPLIKEVCEADIVMCPLCDKRCKVWQLSDTCTYAKVSLLFDNNGTVLFAMFMAVWATLFLEFWKRHRASYVCEWKVSDWCEEEEELNPGNCEQCELVIAAVLLTEGSWEFLSNHSNSGAMMLGAVLHYVIITVMTRVNRIVAMKLCEIEKTRSFAATEKSFTVKMFTFQFFTYFSSLFYVAFFLGRINGHPGGYVRIAGKWRLEECHPSGCLTDLFIQMAIIMVLKQTINNVFEFAGPWFCRWLNRRRTQKLQRKCAHCYLKDESELKHGAELCDNCKLRDWVSNYRLNNVDSFSLFNEFLEMVIQFSFTTIFVAAFPLAPLLALINNIIEIRLDAIKMVTLERRLVPKKTNDIGVWIDVLEAIGVLAVIANGLVIGVSSDFIPRLVYRYRYGPCANGTTTNIDCMVGYINNSLSIARMGDENLFNEFSVDQMVTPGGVNVSYCSYKDYRSNEDYSFTPQFWLILAVRFAFVILFEHVVVICKFIAAWFVPSAPMQVKNDRLFDKLNRLKEELSTKFITLVCLYTESQCSKAPEFKSNGGLTELRRPVGSTVKLNCTALLFWDPGEEQCDTTLQWSKDGRPLGNHTHYTQNTSSWSPVVGQLMVNSLLVITLRELEDFGLYSCTVRNISSDFSLLDSNSPSHTAAVMAAVTLLLFLALAAVVYSRCHLNIKLWYRNSYGEYELNDGKLYDAYISYVNNDHDRKFVNFILKPHLEKKNGYKVHLNDNDILPGSEPSAELLMNMSRSRRLIVLLSYAYLEQDWCCSNFRQGLLHLLELCQQPILIMLEGQFKRMRPEIKQQLSEYQHHLTVLTWRYNSVTPSSVFWKELALAMPRRVVFHSASAGDPQTVLQDDKDPMLTLDPDYLDCRSDADPAGDLGLRLPAYKALACTAPVLPAAPITVPEPKPSDIDVSDLGSRNYGARSDFYCLVTEEAI
ncbi:hypothetical protein L3Q82_023855, partial [Scortum barcoo]